MQRGDRSGGPGGVYVVKLGGSVLTDKRRPFSLRLGVVERLAAELAAARGRLAGLVLGGGSFGHYTARVALEEAGGPGEVLGLVSAAMMELALAVVDVLHSKGLYTLVLPPHAFCRPRGLRPGCDWAAARAARNVGAVPLTYGDAYPCSRGACIVSGDELLLEMACALGASEAVYVTDVDGLIVGGRLVEEVGVDELAALAAGGRSEGYDVTGGFARKLEALRQNLCPGLRSVWIVNGLKPGRLQRLLEGDRVTATRVTLL